MSTSRSRCARAALTAATFALLLAASPSTIAAQEAPSTAVEAAEPSPPPLPVQDELFPLEPAALSALARLQSDWLDWLVACNEGDGDRVDATLESLLSHIELLGMESVPALSTAAAQRAIEFAEAGDFERARWGLTAARRLHSGRPEESFAAASLAAAEGSRFEQVTRSAEGYWRLFAIAPLRSVVAGNLLLWLGTVLTLTGLLLVGILMISRGPELYFDCYRYFMRFVPSWTSHLLAVTLLVWPLLLPAGVLWTALYWSVLLWSYGGRVERVVLAAFWLFVVSVPSVVGTLNQRVSVSLFPPVQSLESAARGELEGDLFNHLGLLLTILPNDVALKHLNADVHRKLHQMEYARQFYQEVLQAEGQNVSALNEMGIYYFEVSDFERAADFFQAASEDPAPPAEVLFNLSQTHSELYQFNESEDALIRARAVDSDAVNRWLQEAQVQKVVPLDGGLERVGEVEAALRSQWRLGEDSRGWFARWRQAVSLPLIALFVLIAVAVRFLGRRGRPAKATPNWLQPKRDRFRRVLFAGVAEAELGYPGRAVLWLLILVAILSIPLLGRSGYSLPWLHEPAPSLLPLLSAAALALFFGVRLWMQARGMYDD